MKCWSSGKLDGWKGGIWGVVLILLFPVGCLSEDSLLVELFDQEEENKISAEYLADLREHPVWIGSTSKEEWQRIPFLSEQQINQILDLQKKLPLTSISQLNTILDETTCHLISGFLTIRKPHRLHLRIRQSNYLSRPVPEEIKTKRYKGSALVNTTRLNFQYNERLRIGLIAAKDAGEPSYTDRFGGYLMISGKRFQIIAGNFKLRHGNGLLFANPYSNMKSSYATLAFRKTGTIAKPSADRSSLRTLTGVTLNWRLTGNLNILASQALNRRDAYLGNDGATVTGMRDTDYHRTETEIASQNKIRESLSFLAVGFQTSDWFHTTLAVSGIRFSPGFDRSMSIIGEKQSRRTFFAFSGKQLRQSSLTYALQYGSLLFSGEYAASFPNGRAWTQNGLIKKKKFQFGIKIWQISKSFQSPYGGAFDDASPFPQAKSGFYLGARWKPARGVTVNAYTLVENGSWRSYFDPLPTASGGDMINIEFKHRGNRLQLRYTCNSRESYRQTDNANNSLTGQKVRHFRVNYSMKPAKGTRCRFRWHHCLGTTGVHSGTNLYHDLRFHLSPNLRLHLRTSFFKTDNYTVRIYEYEPALPYSFASYPLYGEGKKYVVLLKQKIGNTMTTWFKWRYLELNPGDEMKKRMDYRLMLLWEF